MKFLVILLCAVLGIGYFQPQWIEAKLAPLVGENSETSEAKVYQSKVYKSIGANGEISFSNTPPAQGKFESMTINGNVNVIKAQPVFVPPMSKDSESMNQGEPSSALNFGKVKQLFDDAKGVQGLLDQRDKDMDHMIQRAQ